MDADDISYSSRLKLQHEFLENNEKCVVVGSNAFYLDKNGVPLYASKLPIDASQVRSFLPASPFFHSATMFRIDIFRKVGGYSLVVPHFIEDKILWNQMARYGDLCNIQDVLLGYRIVPSSITAHKFTDNYLLETVFNKIMNGIDVNDYERAKLNLLRKSKPDKKYLMSNYHNKIGKIYLENCFSRLDSFNSLIRSIWFSPSNANSWFNLVLLLFPKPVIYWWKSKRGVNIV